MKLSLVPLLLVSIGLCFLLVVLWFQSSSHYQQDGNHKYYKPKKHVHTQLRVEEVIETKPVQVHNASYIVPVKVLDEVASPTSPPILEDVEKPPLLPDENDPKLDTIAKYLSSVDAKPPAIQLQKSKDAFEEILPHTPDPKAEVPSLVVPEDVHKTLDAAPVTLTLPEPETTLPSLFQSNIIIDRLAEDTSGVFRSLREIYTNALEEELATARDQADVISAQADALEATSSVKDMVGKSFEFRTLTRVHRALRTGATCLQSITPGGPHVDNTLLSSIQTLLETNDESLDSKTPIAVRRTKSFIEYAPNSRDVSNNVAFALSAAYPTVTVLLLQFSDASTISPSESLLLRGRSLNPYTRVCNAERPGSNMYIANADKNSLDRKPLVMDCVQSIADLNLLVNNLLPFEYEEVLGNILCRCNATYVPLILPDNPYFAFWDSTGHLLRSVGTVVSDTCTLSFDLNGNGHKAASVVRSSHVLVLRNSTTVSTGPSGTGSRDVPSAASSSRAYRSDYLSTSSYSTFSASSSAPFVPPTAEGAALLEKSLAASYLTVGQLASLSLDAHSRHHLWSAVSSYLSSRRGKDYLLASPLTARSGDTASKAASAVVNHTVHDLVLHGSTARTALDILTEKAGRGMRSLEPNMGALSADYPASGRSERFASSHRSIQSIQSRDELRSLEATDKVVSASIVSSPVVAPLVAETKNLSTSAPDSALLLLSREAEAAAAAAVNVVDAQPPVVAGGNDTGTASPRRRLYVVSRGSASSSNVVSRAGGAGAGASVGADVFPEQAQDLTWEYPDHAHSVSGGTEEFDETDYAIKNQFLALSDSADSDYSSFGGTSNRNGRRFSLSTASRDLQRHLHLREASSYRRWMLALKTPIDFAGSETALPTTATATVTGLSHLASAGLVYVMGRQVSLLSLKLSKLLAPQKATKRHANGLLVSLLSDSLSFKSHSLLTAMMALKNNIICRPAWNTATLAALLASPERASLSVIQADVVVEIIVSALSAVKSDGIENLDSAEVLVGQCKVDLLEESFAALLSMSGVSYIELPSVAILTELFEHAELPVECQAFLLQRYAGPALLLEQSVRQLKLGASASIHEVFAPGNDSPAEVRIYRVHIQHTATAVAPAADAESSSHPMGFKFTHKSSHVGLSLYTALHLRIVDAQKKVLLKMMIDFPLWKFKPSMDVAPWELFIRLTDGVKDGPASRADWSLFYSAVEQHSSAGEHGGYNHPRPDGIDAVSRNHAHYTAELRTDNADFTVGVSLRPGSPQSDRIQGRAVWKALEYELSSHSAEVAQGKFSFVEHDSGFGYVSLRLAKSYPNATVISIERNPGKVRHHVSMVKSLFVDNNAVCQKTEADSVIYKNIYESPELFRFQLLSRSMLDGFIESESLVEWGSMVGTMLSAALTTFIYAPHSAQVSWAMSVLFSEVYEFVPSSASATSAASASAAAGGAGFRRYNLHAPVRPLSDVFGGTSAMSRELEFATQLNALAHHPQFPYRDFEKQWVLENARVNSGNTAVQLSPLAARDKLSDYSKDKLVGGFNIPLVRCDIVNMTRHVHHHYDYSKDGHSRTYTMRVKVNQTLGDVVMSSIGDPSHTSTRATSNGIVLRTINHNSIFSNRDAESARDDVQEGLLLPLGFHPNQHSVVGVHLLRDRDSFPIPYTNIYGVTLISALRLGLEPTLRDRLFKSFLKMPLYEDMAPWNVVLMGQVQHALVCVLLVLPFRVL